MGEKVTGQEEPVYVDVRIHRGGVYEIDVAHCDVVTADELLAELARDYILERNTIRDMLAESAQG